MRSDIPAESAFETVLRWNQHGKRIRRRGQILDSPYLEPPTIIEGQAGSPLGECMACNTFREGIQTAMVEFCRKPGDKCCHRKDGPACYPELIPGELCPICRRRYAE